DIGERPREFRRIGQPGRIAGGELLAREELVKHLYRRKTSRDASRGETRLSEHRDERSNVPFAHIPDLLEPFSLQEPEVPVQVERVRLDRVRRGVFLEPQKVEIASEMLPHSAPEWCGVLPSGFAAAPGGGEGAWAEPGRPLRLPGS